MNRQIGDYTIRDFTLSDAPSIAKYADNQKIASMLRDLFPSPYGINDAEVFLAMVTAQSPRSIFAIADTVKAGFEYEGRLRSSVVKDGKILDQFMYAKII